jgi:paraquat-inducible protein B
LTYIELDFVDPAEYPPQLVPWQPKADYIPSMPSTLMQVQDSAQQVLTKLSRVDVDRLATQLTGLLIDLRNELSGGDVHATLNEAINLLRKTNETVQAADLPGLIADAKQTSAALRDTVHGEHLQKLLANASLAADRLATAAAKLPALIASVQATSRRTDNGVADVEQGLVPLLRDLQATTANLRELTDSLSRYPAQVLLQGPPPRSAVPAK